MVQIHYGSCLTALGRFEDAEVELLESYELASQLGENRLYPYKAAAALTELYEAWGNPEKASEYRARMSEAEGGARLD